MRARHTQDSYVGITRNWKRRKRQHNACKGEGAQFTKRHPGQWRGYFHVYGFVKRRYAAQFEYAMKHQKRGSWLQGRCKTLWRLMDGVTQWTQRDGMTARRMRLCVYMTISKARFLTLIGETPQGYRERREQVPTIRYRFSYKAIY